MKFCSSYHEKDFLNGRCRHSFKIPNVPKFAVGMKEWKRSEEEWKKKGRRKEDGGNVSRENSQQGTRTFSSLTCPVQLDSFPNLHFSLFLSFCTSDTSSPQIRSSVPNDSNPPLLTSNSPFRTTDQVKEAGWMTILLKTRNDMPGWCHPFV